MPRTHVPEQAPAAEPPAGVEAAADSTLGRGARILPVAIGVTGLVTYAYLGLASHVLTSSEYGYVALLWSAVMITTAVLYRPVEQLLSRTTAERAAHGIEGHAHLRVAATIQAALALVFAIVALALHDTLQNHLLGGSSELYWIMVVAVLAYAASYFARGFLAGHRRFDLYGGLVLMESCSRCVFALAVAVGVASGQSAVALGIAAAPILSLSVVPWALGRRLRAGAPGDALPAGTDPGGLPDVAEADERERFTLAHGTGFAGAVLLVMLCDQTFLNAGPLVVKATTAAGAAALAGFAFNALIVARAALQLFQAVQTVILPHLTTLRASGQRDPFRRSVDLTLLAIAAFAAIAALVMLVAGPTLMHVVFGDKGYDYGRLGLVLVSVGMGCHLAGATLNQAALARSQARAAAVCWLVAAAGFLALLAVPAISDRVLRVEVAYVCGTALLGALLYRLYRRADPAA
jgi:O-antigen/teichoic acid export membrane protein